MGIAKDLRRVVHRENLRPPVNPGDRARRLWAVDHQRRVVIGLGGLLTARQLEGHSPDEEKHVTAGLDHMVIPPLRAHLGRQERHDRHTQLGLLFKLVQPLLPRLAVQVGWVAPRRREPLRNRQRVRSQRWVDAQLRARPVVVDVEVVVLVRGSVHGEPTHRTVHRLIQCAGRLPFRAHAEAPSLKSSSSCVARKIPNAITMRRTPKVCTGSMRVA